MVATRPGELMLRFWANVCLYVFVYFSRIAPARFFLFLGPRAHLVFQHTLNTVVEFVIEYVCALHRIIPSRWSFLIESTLSRVGRGGQ